MTSSIFSYVGMDLVAVTAAETRGFGDSESIKIATRKISLRVIIFYFLASVAVSFPVAYDDPNLLTSNRGLASAASSPFTIAIYNAGIPVLPHILNAFLIFSSTATGISGLYGASRTLHALAVSGRVLDGPVARSLQITHSGVPVVAVLASGIFGFLAFMSINSGPAKVLLNL
jgi:yeast amino acid transporter